MQFQQINNVDPEIIAHLFISDTEMIRYYYRTQGSIME
jgi:hypothetical protein